MFVTIAADFARVSCFDASIVVVIALFSRVARARASSSRARRARVVGARRGVSRRDGSRRRVRDSETAARSIDRVGPIRPSKPRDGVARAIDRSIDRSMKMQGFAHAGVRDARAATRPRRATRARTPARSPAHARARDLANRARRARRRTRAPEATDGERNLLDAFERRLPHDETRDVAIR